MYKAQRWTAHGMENSKRGADTIIQYKLQAISSRAHTHIFIPKELSDEVALRGERPQEFPRTYRTKLARAAREKAREREVSSNKCQIYYPHVSHAHCCCCLALVLSMCTRSGYLNKVLALLEARHAQAVAQLLVAAERAVLEVHDVLQALLQRVVADLLHARRHLQTRIRQYDNTDSTRQQRSRTDN